MPAPRGQECSPARVKPGLAVSNTDAGSGLIMNFAVCLHGVSLERTSTSDGCDSGEAIAVAFTLVRSSCEVPQSSVQVIPRNTRPVVATHWDWGRCFLPIEKRYRNDLGALMDGCAPTCRGIHPHLSIEAARMLRELADLPPSVSFPSNASASTRAARSIRNHPSSYLRDQCLGQDMKCK